MKRPWITAVLDMAILFFASALLILPLFRIEYFNNWMSIEGTFIADARYIRDHWPHPAWHALWYCGNRFDYVYAPGTRYGAAIASMLLHVSPALGYHIFSAVMYCLGIAGMYFLVRTGTGSRGAALLAAGIEAFVSPVLFFMKDYRDDSLLWMPERLNFLIKWGEGPHLCSLAIVPFALAFSLLAFRSGSRRAIAAAAFCCALIVLNNLYGALGLGVFFPVLVWSVSAASPARPLWRRAGLIVLLTAGLCAWWLTPSFIRLTHRNLMLVALPGNRWSQYAGLAVVLVFAIGSLLLGRVRRVSAWSIFVAGSLLFFGLEVLGQRWVDFRITGEPKRFLPELEIMLILAMVAGIRLLWRFNRWAAIAATIACFSISVRYMAKPWSVYSADPNFTQRVEYRMPEWIAQNLPGSRVFTFGSVSYWYTTWRDLLEVNGGADQGAQTLMAPLARYQIRIEGDPQRDVYWLQSLGADAIILHDANSQEIYHEVTNPRKFIGHLPVLYDKNGDIIYRVPRRPGLARIVDERRISGLEPIPWSYKDRPQLQAYAETLEAIDTPAAFSSPSIGEIDVSATTQPGQSVLVQENYDPGWKAWVDGKPVAIEKDIMEFMRVRTSAGAHQVRFVYGMATDSRIGMWISIVSLLAVAALLLPVNRTNLPRKRIE